MMNTDRKNTAPEYHTGLEYQPLPDEYLQHGQFGSERVEKRSHRWMRMLCMLTACGALAYSVYVQSGVANPVITPGLEQEPEQTPPVQIQEPTEETASHETAEALAEPVEESLSADGILYYKIYNETMLDQPTADAWELILEEGEISIERLLAGDTVALPQPEVPEGFEFLGWVAYFGRDTEAKWQRIEGQITKEDAARIKPDVEGNRKLNIHGAWRALDAENSPNRLTLDANGGSLEGESAVTYNALTPKYSGGTVYLCAYPEPVRVGYRFTGWYLDSGNESERVETLLASRFFGETNGEPDYSKSIILHLIAGWEKTEESGN